MNVLRVAQTHTGELLTGEGSGPAGDVELDLHLTGRCDVQDLALASVLDPRQARIAMLGDQRHAVALTDAVVHAGDLGLSVAEFAALEAMVLRPGVEPVDLHIRRIRDQRNLLDRVFHREACPVLNSVLERLITCV